MDDHRLHAKVHRARSAGYLTYERSRTFDLVRYRARWTQLRDAISMMQNKHEYVYVIMGEKKPLVKKYYITNQNSINTQKSQARYKFISVTKKKINLSKQN